MSLSLKSKYRTHTCGALSASDVGASVVLSGWVHRKRDHGSLVFIDLRDNYGITQCVFDNTPGIEKIHPESVITVRGTVVARDGSQINEKIPTGHIEVKSADWEILANADVLPFQVFGDDGNVSEELRFKYRYLDLRHETLHKNILFRNRIVKFMRDKMWDMGFSEFQTPILTVSSPEGARDFLVPSRFHHGQFYALPQAPQQFKQLLQVSGFDRYFQIAPCFRDEDLRADRGLEFYQMDFEMSFVELEQVQEVCEEFMTSVVRDMLPGAKIVGGVPHFTFEESMLKYGSDKPDLRNPIIISDVSEVFRDSEFGIFADVVKFGGVVRAVPADNTAAQPRSWFDKLGDFATSELKLGGLAYIVYGDEVKGPVAKKLDEARIAKIKEITGIKDGAVFFVCDSNVEKAAKAAGKLRIKLGEDLNLIDKSEFRFCCVEDFPFFEFDEDTGKPRFGHNPFSRPQGDLLNLDLSEPLKLKAYQFDMVLNGYELGSGGLRNYNPEVMLKLFAITGMSEEDVINKFGGMYNAFKYGTPPHGGFAFGVDRMVMLMSNETQMRDIVAFPTDQRGRDLMMGSPCEVSEQQLRDVHISIRKK